MGGGDHTKQKNVPKRPRKYSSDETEVIGGGSGGFDKGATGACLLSFKTKISPVTETVGVGDKFVLIPDGSGGLQLIGSGKRIGAYAGNRLNMLMQCIAGGYTYHGEVGNVRAGKDGRTAICTITGKGPV